MKNEHYRPQFVGISGLPRAGSTLLGQLLSQHPEVRCEGMSSPLCTTLLSMRHVVSDDQFFLAQLDNGYEQAYDNLQRAMRGFLQGWTATDKAVTVDKSRGWLSAVETLLHLEPNAKLIVCVRELGQVYGSIEDKHQSSILIDFIDHFAALDRFGRADALFAKDKVIGSALAALHALEDLPASVLEHLYFLRFEDLMGNPQRAMGEIFTWIGVAPVTLDLNNLTTQPQESDSHYRMKFSHRQMTQIRAPKPHLVPARVQRQIETMCAWFYARYYPNHRPLAQAAATVVVSP